MIPSWLLHGDLAPAGNRVVVATSPKSPPAFPGYRSIWLQSGTAALAQAFLIARQRRPEVAAPSVILPAYGCPDLVSAALFAGVRPLLVDINADDAGYNLAQLAQAIDQSTIAILAVNFLGIRERLDDIRELLAGRPDILLIEDNAQWFPEPLEQPALTGDMVCLSFGRGKPVSLLGGGALLIREALACDLPMFAQEEPESTRGLAFKAALINTLLKPSLYWLVNRNPLLELGRTVFHPLELIRPMGAERIGAIADAAERYLSLSRTREDEWSSLLQATPLLNDVAAGPDRRGRLLRYPVLCRNAHEREVIWRAFGRAGLGTTAMYQRALPEIEGVGDKVGVFNDYAGARAFASRLLTLPTHEYVRPGTVQRAVGILESHLAGR